jgi:hypothetical protein
VKVPAGDHDRVSDGGSDQQRREGCRKLRDEMTTNLRRSKHLPQQAIRCACRAAEPGLLTGKDAMNVATKLVHQMSSSARSGRSR